MNDQINEWYGKLHESLQRRDFKGATGFLNSILLNIPFHLSIISQLKLKAMQPRDYVRFLDTYIREYKDDPRGYLLKTDYLYGIHQVDELRGVWRDTCVAAVSGFHFQPPIIAGLYDAEQGLPHTTVAAVGMGGKLSEALEQLRRHKDEWPSDVQSVPSVREATSDSCSVRTNSGEPIGLDEVALNGTLSGFSQPTEYFFRYGDAADALTRETARREMPAGLHGHVRESGANIFHRFTAYAAVAAFNDADVPDTTTSKSPFPAFSVKFDWPFGKDRNHRDGIGIIDLLMGWTSQAHTRGSPDGVDGPPPYPTASFVGEALDMRDAVFSVVYRSDDLNPKDFVPVAWMHGRTGTAVYPDAHDDLAAWAVTGGAPAQFVVDGTWRALEIALPGTSAAWSFCGSNTEEMGSGMERYTYGPIQRLQRENEGGNVCLAFVHGDELDTPEGTIEIAEVALRYRSRSFLGPGQQAVLNDLAAEALNDPACLTDGTLGIPEACWAARISDEQPCDLVWALRDSAELETFKLHQSPLTPARDVVISVSNDGNEYSDVWRGELVEVPKNPAEWGTFAKTGALVRVVVLQQKIAARYIRLRIMSGYRDGMAGLDAFEVFGSGLPFIPSPDQFTFSENIGGLDEGAPVFAQLVAENADGVFEGEIVEIRRPMSATPYIHSVEAAVDGGGMATITARTLAMGATATFSAILDSGDGHKINVPVVAIGKWPVARDVKIKVEGLRPGGTYTGTCHAENEHGQSDIISFECSPTE